MTENERKIQEAFFLAHDNLQYLPDKFCHWRKKTADGRIVSKSLTDYKKSFSFIKSYILRNNLAELRMSLDYHLSIFHFIKPGLLFRWQHKLVIYQILGAIVEGLLTDHLEYLIESQSDVLVNTVAKQRTGSKSFGLGSLVEIYKQAGFFSKQIEIDILENLKDLRNSVHPKSLNKRTNIKDNPLIAADLNKVISSFDKFIGYMKNRY